MASTAVASWQTPGSAARESAYRANNIGVALLEQFDYEGAARSFREALEQHPSLEIARLNLAIALFYAGKTPEASTAAREAAARLANLPQAHYVAGLIYRSEDNLDAARTAFERVLTIDPADAGANVNLGQIGLQQRQYDKALDYFRHAMGAEPYNVTAAYSAALALTRSGKTDEGRKAMQHFEALRDSAYGVTYAQTYLAQGKYAEAIASTGAEPELVNPGTPDVTFSDATATMMQGPGSRESKKSGGLEVGSAGAVLLFDADGDGDLDLIEVGQSGLRFLRNEKGIFQNATGDSGLAKAAAGSGAVTGDYDNDGRPDLFVVRSDGFGLYHQTATNTFEDVSASAGIAGIRPTTPDQRQPAAFADVDHDGDLDLVVAGSPTRLLRNNGNGTFADVAVQAGVSAPLGAVALAATDYDNRRDIDLVVVPREGAPILYRNMRDGSFRDAASESGLPSGGSYSALAVGDVNKDGFSDFVFGRSGQAAVLSMSDGQTKFRSTSAPDETAGTIAAQFVDYDNDGLLDLFTLSDTRAHLFRNIGAGKWSDVTTAARLPSGADDKAPQTRFVSLALGDVDDDGDTDAFVRLSNNEVRFWRNEGGNRNASLRVKLAARVSNRSGIGARVEIRAGSLRQQFESASSTPAAAPADVVFGLGTRRSADVVRVLWPSGILQAETSLAPEGRTVTVTELDRKPSSCPYLFTWNGTRFEFVTDFMGGGEMGAWLAPGVWNHPDPDEYVRLGRDQLRPKDGVYELRVTNELEEALFVDRLQLVAADHPGDVDVFPNEGLRSPPRPPFALTATRGARPPAKAVDEHGHDVLPQLAAVDRRYPDDFRLRSIRGYAEPHFVELDLGVPSERPVLLMTGWTDYAFSSDNVASSQLGESMAPPSVQVKDGEGRWKTVIPETGFPVGRPQTIVVDLPGTWLSASREVRIPTNMRIYWDQILVASRADRATRVSRLDPVAANLAWRGFSAEVTPDGREPFAYDYSRVSGASPWKVMVGRYTREGGVLPLLRDADDMYVISRPGDELSVGFAERALPPLPTGWTRTFLVYSYGWSKEMNPRSASPDTIGPLPFAAMSGYPYGPNEHYPRSPKHREYMDRYNTRIVSKAVPAIDASLR